MKVSELFEDAEPYVVYKVSSPKVDVVYYGYATGEDVRKSFMVGANRQDNPDRGDVRMINLAGGEENLNFEIIDVFNDEIEAFADRNDRRAHDSQSITGPSMFPGSVFQRLKAQHPDRVAKWKNARSLDTMTAREAMAEKMSEFTFQDLKAIATPETKQQIVDDLDRLSYHQFKEKYFPTK